LRAARFVLVLSITNPSTCSQIWSMQCVCVFLNLLICPLQLSSSSITNTEFTEFTEEGLQSRCLTASLLVKCDNIMKEKNTVCCCLD
jgi:hypothetical protein